jgi:hypothetical protein
MPLTQRGFVLSRVRRADAAPGNRSVSLGRGAPYRRDGGATGQAFCSHARWDSEQARSALIAEHGRTPPGVSE